MIVIHANRKSLCPPPNHRRQRAAILHVAVAVLIAAAVSSVLSAARGVRRPEPFEWHLPKWAPVPPVPPDNPMTIAKVTLGRYLFYDVRLSGNQTQSCASCHRQELAFTDGQPRAIGSTGGLHPRSTMSLVNVAYAEVLTWSNPTLTRLEDQALVPMFGDQPIELGLRAPDTGLLAAVRGADPYPRLFSRAYPDDGDPVTVANIVRALASFERSIVSARSPYDRFHFDGEAHVLSAAAQRGEALFFSRSVRCFRCHSGFTFAETTEPEGGRRGAFHNTGLYNLTGLLSYPAPNTGIYQVTHDPLDVGRFKAPTLRNIAITAPYMHDGSIATLDEVLDHYAAGGRTIPAGLNRGVGRDNPNKSPIIQGFSLTGAQRSDLLDFLLSLTDTDLLHDARFSNPWSAVR
jgi:cytochrome c peroxidase